MTTQIEQQQPPSSAIAATPLGGPIRFPALDGMRGLAALAVVTTHVGFQSGRTGKPGPIGYLLARGDFGVTVFFLLSGFLLYRPFADGLRQHVLPTYFRRRALRIMPVYWLAAVLALLLLPEAPDLGPDEWLTQLLLLQVYIDQALPAGLTQMWSLTTEVAFYVVLPLFALLVAALRRRRGDALGGRTDIAALGTLVVLGCVWTTLAAGPHLPTAANLWLPGYADWFALGMGLALLHQRATRSAPDRVSRALHDLGQAPGTCLAVAVLLFLLAATPLGGPKLLNPPTQWEALIKHVLYGLSAMWLLLPAIFAAPLGNPWTRLLASRPLHAIGQISYSIFALHLVVLHFTLKALDLNVFQGHFAKVWIVTVTATLVTATVSYWLVERPAINWSRRPSRRRVKGRLPIGAGRQRG